MERWGEGEGRDGLHKNETRKERERDVRENVIIMEICKAPTLRLKALNKHIYTPNVHRDGKCSQKKKMGSSITMQNLNCPVQYGHVSSFKSRPTSSTVNSYRNDQEEGGEKGEWRREERGGGGEGGRSVVVI